MPPVEQRVVEFVEVLRQNGLPVSVSETQDALEALALVGVADEGSTRAVLASTLCKRTSDAPVFHRAFDFFFSGAVKMLQDVERSLLARIEAEGLLEGDELKMLLATLSSLGGQLAPLTRAALEGDRGRLAQLFRQASLQLDFAQLQSSLQTGFFGRRLGAAAGTRAMQGDLQAIEAELKARGLSVGGLEIVSRHLADALRRVEAAARAEVQREASARVKRETSSLADRPMERLSREEVEQAGRAVRALAEKLKARLVRRERARRRGQLSPRRTLRRNLTSGGVPMVPQFRGRRPLRPDVVVLCDVSDSVRNVSRMMLLFTATLQGLFSRVRSFIFVSELGEVTHTFRGRPPEEAVEAALSSDVISLMSNSNYGHALAAFARGHLGGVTRRTTVFVIGDGRNNFNAANAWALEEVKRRARRVVWICTEPESSWGLGDSEMRAYARVASQVVTVQSLGDLERVAAQLLPA